MKPYAGVVMSWLFLAACTEPDWPKAPPEMNDLWQEFRRGSLLREPKLAGCYRVSVSNVGGAFPYQLLPEVVVHLTTDGKTDCCGADNGHFSVGWSTEAPRRFHGVVWSQETGGEVHVSFGDIFLHLRRSGRNLVGTATMTGGPGLVSSSPGRPLRKVNPRVTLTRVPCEGIEFRYHFYPLE